MFHNVDPMRTSIAVLDLIDANVENLTFESEPRCEDPRHLIHAA